MADATTKKVLLLRPDDSVACRGISCLIDPLGSPQYGFFYFFFFKSAKECFQQIKLLDEAWERLPDRSVHLLVSFGINKPLGIDCAGFEQERIYMAQTLLDTMEEEKNISGEPLKLNVYDLTHMNGYMYWFGLGVYHSAIEAYGTEYAYGAHDYPTSGVFEVEPRQCPGFKFRKSLTIGTIWMGPDKFREFVEEIACEYSGDSYHLLFKNCNHFCDDVCLRLIGSHLPRWINRLAKIGAVCRCFVPDVLQPEGIKAVDYETCDDNDAKCAEFTLLCKHHEIRSDIFSEDVPLSTAYRSTDI